MILYLHTASIVFQFPEGLILPATVGMFSTSQERIRMEILTTRAKSFLINDIRHLNQDHYDRSGEPYMDGDAIERDVKHAKLLSVQGYSVQVFQPAREILLKSWVNPN